MKNFFAWFVKPPVLSFIGVLLLSLLIWFGGPQLGFGESHPMESETVRWVMIGIAFALWAGYFLWKWLQAKLANAQLMKSIAGEGEAAPAPGAQESAAEVAQLSKLMQEAMGTLKKSGKGKFGSQYMYQLPWYMFVGAPGTGKTTALTQSGLNFPLAESMGKRAIGGVGGTRNCDWWFTEEAVLLDTAGRYTTQDSYAEVDKAGWFGFLDLLKKHRRRRPINGVIVAVSAAELLTMTEQERKTQALAIRERIKELHDRLEIRFPIYVLVTKCDLLAGFIEFFDNLGRDERSQVWGTTFPVIDPQKVDDLLQAFPQEFRALEQQLQARVLSRVQAERDVQRRALIYSFPQQFAAVGENLNLFLHEVFQSTRYEERALLRGVYFSSGTQEGSPIDRVMGALAGAFGLDRQALPPGVNQGRSYFLTRLLTDVIFKEADLVGANLRFEKQRKQIFWGSCIALGLFLVVAMVSLGVSYKRNQDYIAQVQKQVDDLNAKIKQVPQSVGPLTLLPVLDDARKISGGYTDQKNKVETPLFSRFGLSQRPKLGDGAMSTYQRVLKQGMLPLVQARLEEELRKGSAANPDELYETLRVYLMLGDGKHFEAESIGAWIAFDWDRSLNGANENQKAALEGHIGALLESVKDDTPISLNKDLIEGTRLVLANMPLDQKVYNRVKRDLGAARLPEFSAQNAGGLQAPQVFARASGQPLTRGVPGVFTLAGYQKFDSLANTAVADVAKDSWVLDKQEDVGSPQKIEQLKKAVEKLYYDEYIKQWNTFLADVRIKPYSSLDEGARIMTILAGGESPLKKFIQAAAKETTVANADTGKAVADAAAGMFKGKIDAAKEKLKSAIGADPTAAPTPTVQQHPIDKEFERLRLMAGLNPAAAAAAAGAGGAPPPGGGAAPIDGTIAMMKELALYMSQANQAKLSGQPAPAGDILTRIKMEGEGKPEPLAGMLKNVDNATSGLTKGSERERINSLWSAGVAQFCRQAIAGRYPMVRSASQEVTADDFGRFFAPGGLMDDFFQKNLAAYVNQGGATWSWRPVGNSDLGIPPHVLAQFQRAAKIRDAFFGQGGKQASWRFDLNVLSADPALLKLTLDIDGQQLQYAAGTPSRSVNIQLPSGKGNGDVRFFDVMPALSRDMRTSGTWAWMRMMDQGRLEANGGKERFKLSFTLDGKPVVLDVRASSVINPFERSVLEQFSCMDKL
ncbi:type VI secretion system membrane subunit TssM [Massilia sp. W12]|uniref:type VI secretion system membrane subunit TssM n=1 Tax=Massilia sp. W12 TaxID=3126507 RepID=UPI0030CF5FFB